MVIYVSSRGHAMVKKLFVRYVSLSVCVAKCSHDVLEHYLPSTHANEGSRDELEKYFSPWLFVLSFFQRVMGSGRLGGGGEARNGTKFHMEQQEKTLYN